MGHMSSISVIPNGYHWESSNHPSSCSKEEWCWVIFCDIVQPAYNITSETYRNYWTPSSLDDPWGVLMSSTFFLIIRGHHGWKKCAWIISTAQKVIKCKWPPHISICFLHHHDVYLPGVRRSTNLPWHLPRSSFLHYSCCHAGIFSVLHFRTIKSN